MNDLSGQIVRSYRLYERLAVGGFGAVYRAYQPVIERDVAIKVILPRYANEAEFIRRFEVEAQTVARLEHPHIVPLYDFWRDPDGAYLVMRWLRGGSLRDRIRQGPMDPADVARVLDQIGSALDMAHRAGIVHRDLKPENILFDEDRNAYLTDFGIAQKQGYSDESVTGSANYIAPEQLRSEPTGSHSDIYSFGILVFEMLTAHHPFHGLPISELIIKQLREPLPELGEFQPNLPPELNLVVQRATMKDTDSRYTSLLEFTDAFRQASGLGGTASTRRNSQRVIENPYKGLRPFEEADSEDFFGREELVQRLIERLYDDDPLANFLAVVGPSGSGKSSVVRAGLIPELRRGAITGSSDWFVADMVPGTQPLQNLEMALLQVSPHPLPQLTQQLQTDATALSQAGCTIARAIQARLLLFIDQFEEIFTLTTDESARRHFLALLQTAVSDPESPLTVVIAMRADFFDRPLLYGEIGALIQMRTQVVLPLSASELERAITGPAYRVGLELEGELIAAIVADISHEPGALPLLQYALTELYERRQGRRLTLSAYQASGGVQGALARRAADVYAALSPAHQEIARQIFLRMVSLGEGAEDTRRRVYRNELFGIQAERTAINSVLDFFGQYRLLTFDSDSSTREPMVDIAHEALIRRWDQLRIWLDESRNDIRQQRTLGLAAIDWLQHQREVGYLLHGSRLAQFEEWAQQTTVALTEHEQTFLQTSINHRQQQAQEEQERQQREQRLEARSRQLLRGLVAVLTVFGLIAAGLALFALQQSRLAENERDNAQMARATSDANAVEAQQQLALAEQRAIEVQNLNLLNEAARALASGDSGLAMSLELAVAARGGLRPEVQNEIYEVAYASWLRTRLQGHERKISALALSPDGQVLATGSEDLAIGLWQMPAGTPLLTLSGHRGPINSLAFSPDGTRLISGATDGTLKIWDAATGSELLTLSGHRGPITDLAISPDGLQVVSSSADGTIIVWEIQSGLILQTLSGHQGSVRTVAYSPDGRWIVSGGRDTLLIVWDQRTGAQITTLAGHTASVEALSVSSDGTLLLSGAADGNVILWNLLQRRIVYTLAGHIEGVTAVALAPDGRSAVSTGCALRDVDRSCVSGDIIVWDLVNGLLQRHLIGHKDTTNAVIYDHSGERIYTASCGERRQSICVSGEVLVWDTIQPGDSILHHALATGTVQSTAMTPDGTIGAIGGTGQTNQRVPIVLWDLQNGTALRVLEGHTGTITRLIFTDTGNQLLSASEDGTLRLWDLNSNDPPHIIQARGSIADADLTADNRTVLVADDAGIMAYDLESGESRTVINSFGNEIVARALRLSPDETIFAVGLNNGTIQFHSMNGEEQRRLIAHTDDVLSLAFSRDGQTLVSASGDGRSILWETASGRQVQRFIGHSGAVTSAALSPDGNYLLTGGTDGTLLYWNVQTATLIRTFHGHTNAIFEATLSNDGGYALSGSADGSARYWRISLSALMDWIISNRYQRALSDAELDQFLLREPAN